MRQSDEDAAKQEGGNEYVGEGIIHPGEAVDHGNSDMARSLVGLVGKA
jgi:hypothetical protein